jgi:hypothetical protein
MKLNLFLGKVSPISLNNYEIIEFMEPNILTDTFITSHEMYLTIHVEGGILHTGNIWWIFNEQSLQFIIGIGQKMHSHGKCFDIMSQGGSPLDFTWRILAPRILLNSPSTFCLVVSQGFPVIYRFVCLIVNYHELMWMSIVLEYMADIIPS